MKIKTANAKILKKNLHAFLFLMLALDFALLTGCHSFGRQDGVPSGRLDPNNIVDAQPRHEAITRAGNKSPYTVLGKTYTLLPSSKGYRVRGMASWYGSKFHGESTANGETYDAMAMTAAHCTLPIPSYVQVTNLENGRRAIVRVNDRGPFVDNRVIDLSYAAATKLGYANKGTALVEVVAIDVDNWPPSRGVAELPATAVVASERVNDGANTASVPFVAAQPSAAAVPAPVTANPPINAMPNTATEARADSNAFSSGHHYVQAGAFHSEAAAQDLRRRLQQITGQAVEVKVLGSPPLYRVRVGPLPNREVAEQVRSTLAAGPVRDARIVSE
jgi:rare lipoprotein A